MIEPLAYVGITHRTAPIGVREKCAPRQEHWNRLLDDLAPLVQESVLLSTCGRLEVYAFAEVLDSELWKEAFARLSNHHVEVINPYIRFRQGRSVLDHLLRVAGGLDSQVLGEDQILSQVRLALGSARQGGHVGPHLSRMFEAAVHTGKRIRHETSVNRIPRSFARVATENLRREQAIGGISNGLILGSGTMAREAASELRRHAQVKLTVAGRNLDRARLFARDFDARVASLDDLARELESSDVLFACTSSTQYLLNPQDIAPRRRFLHIFDLGLPRNVHPAVARHPRVRVVDLDALSPDCSFQSRIVHAAENIVAEESERLLAWFERRRLYRRVGCPKLSPSGFRRSRTMIDRCCPRPEVVGWVRLVS